ncbi:serine protease, subtilase family [Shewanella sediminis HAW-EB3]|uniref:Serine protease, subtilase family n=1 Tax=Shewanella sediminis (strain HAW-EB3) TaxID=425104 RepID=A8FZT1_SHESH|nr:alpha/beta hydrolase [Shewanella sediminis]ABV38354.1 serine protease, subtilase family [Shewanella sediminis HAW-EB3]
MANVVFIHGIANKPEKKILHQLWLNALALNDGIHLGAEGIESTMVYWADVLYESPKKEMAEHENNDSVVEPEDYIDMSWLNELKGQELDWAIKLQKQLGYSVESPDGTDDYCPSGEVIDELETLDFERIPLPWWLKRRLMKILLKDVHHYLFNVEYSPRTDDTFSVQDEIRNRFIKALEQARKKEGPLIVVSHSMGTVIAYDCLTRDPRCPKIDSLITIGSPLGLDEIQDKLQPEWTRENGFPGTIMENWFNIYDRLDPVASLDPNLSNDYQKQGAEVIKDINEQNSGVWRHNISKYLMGAEFRAILSSELKLEE